MKMHVDSGINKPEYQNHQVFELIEHIWDFYEGIGEIGAFPPSLGRRNPPIRS